MCADLKMRQAGTTAGVVQVEAAELVPMVAVIAVVVVVAEHGAVSTPIRRERGAHPRTSARRVPAGKLGQHSGGNGTLWLQDLH